MLAMSDFGSKIIVKSKQGRNFARKARLDFITNTIRVEGQKAHRVIFSKR